MDVHPLQAWRLTQQRVNPLQGRMDFMFGRSACDLTRDERHMGIRALFGCRRFQRDQFMRALPYMNRKRCAPALNGLLRHQDAQGDMRIAHSALAPESRTMTRHLSCSRCTN